MPLVKAFDPAIELKADDPGTFRATIATYGVVDRDGDVTFPGAMPVGKEIVISAYGHKSWEGELPVGKGTLGSDDHRAYVEGRFFDTLAGQDTYKTVKGMYPLGEWSYAYDVKNAVGPDDPKMRDYPGGIRGLLALDVHEASPVLLGAGIGTRTDFVKSFSPATLDDHAARSLADLAAYVEGEATLVGLRAGRKHGGAGDHARLRLQGALAALDENAATIRKMLEDTDEVDGTALTLAFEQLRARARANGVTI